MTKSILITGGAGFIGSHTAELLLQKKQAVTIFDNLSTGKLSNLEVSSPYLRFIQGDVLNYAAVLAAVKESSAVLHLAALPSVPRSIEDPVHSHNVNMSGFLHVLQAIREVQRPIRLVYASSSAVYGEAKQLPCSDETALNPAVLSPYALQKVQNEQYAALYAELFGVHSLALRYFNVYGSRQDPQSVYSGVISRFLERYEQGRSMTIFGDGQQSRDFIHVSDVARANYLALQATYQGALNIATGIPETISHLLAYIEEAGQKKAALEFAPPRLGDIRESYASIVKAKEALDFQPEISLRQGIRQLLLES